MQSQGHTYGDYCIWYNQSNLILKKFKLGDIIMIDFLSSFLLISSWLLFAISAYLLFWAIIMPILGFIPFCLVLSAGFLCFSCSKKLDSRSKTT